MGPVRQPRTWMGVIRSIEHHNGVISISHGFSSSKVLTWQPRTRVGRPCSVWRPSMVTSIQHGSLSITGQINAPTITDINNHNPTFHTHTLRGVLTHLPTPLPTPLSTTHPCIGLQEALPAGICAGDHNTVDSVVDFGGEVEKVAGEVKSVTWAWTRTESG